MPPLAPQPDQVQAALDELLGWTEVARSPQLAKFLKHIVHTKLRGEEGSIKAYSIAVDVFGRPPTFDPQADPIVRVQARRLRGLLQEFYRQNLGRSSARITLPVGRYVPEFESLVSGGVVPAIVDVAVEVLVTPLAPPVEKPKSPKLTRHFWVQGAAALGLVILLGAILLTLQYLRNGPPVILVPKEPTLLVSTFENATATPEKDLFVSRFSERLGALLAQYEDLQVGYAEKGQSVSPDDSTFLLTGAIREVGAGMEITARVTEGSDGPVVWSRTYTAAQPAADDDAALTSAASKISLELGPFRSPLHVGGRRWLDAQVGPLPAVNGYVCLLLYRYARETLGSARMAEAMACNERLLAVQPELPLILAAQAWLENTVVVNEAGPGDDMEKSLAKALALAERARVLAPESSFAYEQLGVVQNWQGRFGAAHQSFAISLGFQALNTDSRAAYAISLFRSGNWEEGAVQAKRALADTTHAPAWYHYPLALERLRAGDPQQALVDAKIAASLEGRQAAAVLALSIAGMLADTAEIALLTPSVMSTEQIRRYGIIPWLSIRVKDQQMLNTIANGLRSANVQPEALTAPF